MKIKKLLLILGAVLLLFAGCKPAVNPPVNPGEKTSEPPSAGGNDNGSKDNNSGSQGGNSGNNSGNPAVGTDGKYIPLTEAYNPTIGDGKRKKSLQYIFNTDSVGESEIYIKRSEWNKMLAYYDYFYKNENTVAVERFTYKKDGMQWDLKDCGMRLRGNTSRFRPQGKDKATDETGHKMPNADWNPDYYSYAANCSDDDYRQSHFKIDFEPYDVKQKLAGCMKGVALKRMDGAYAREILCYDLFHEYDVFCATRASHTKVTIYMIEEDETVTPVDFGVYEMFEEVNNQFLKARDEADPSAEHTFLHWANADGDLWKCSGDLTPLNVRSRAGIEDVCIKSDGVEIKPGETKDKSWSVTDNRYGYDLKTNKKDFDAAKGRLVAFANELEALRNLPVDDAGIAQRKAFYEKWFDMDLFLTTYAVNVAVGMDDDYWGNANNFYLYFDNAPGGTGKCFLIPFDYDNTLGQSINGDGVYNNPLDWGWNHNAGSRNDRPLMDRLLEVPEYRKLYRKKLLEVTAEDSAWSMAKSGAKVTKWKNMVSANDTDGKPLTYSKDLDNNKPLNSLYWDDQGGWKKIKHYLNREPNIYDQVRTNFKTWIALDRGIDLEIDFNGGSSPETGIEQTEPVSFKLDLKTFQRHSLEGVTLADALPVPKKEGAIFEGWTKTKDGNDFVENEIPEKVYAKWSNPENIDYLFIYELEPGMKGYKEDYEGIQIRILNPPSLYSEENNKAGARVRQIYVNGVKVTDVSNSDEVEATTWGFPYTEAGKDYTVYVKYLKEDYWNQHSITNKISIKAKSGKGKFTLETDTVSFNVSDNVISFSPNDPEIYVAGERISSANNPGYYQITFHDPNWSFDIYPSIEDYRVEDFNVLELIKQKYPWELDKAFANDIQTQMRYIVQNNDGFGDYRLEINISGRDFNLTLPEIPEIGSGQGNMEQPGIFLSLPGDELPKNVYIRRIRLNGVLVSDIRSYSDSERKLVFSNEWYYPYVIPGKKYDFSVEYLNEDWNTLYVKEGSITPEYGRGEIDVETMPVYKVDNNILTWTTQPVLKIKNGEEETVITKELFEQNYRYNLNLTTTSWGWCTWKDEASYTLSDFNVKELCEERNPEKLETALSNECFMTLSIKIGNNSEPAVYPYGEYVYEILNDSSKMNFRLN